MHLHSIDADVGSELPDSILFAELGPRGAVAGHQSLSKLDGEISLMSSIGLGRLVVMTLNLSISASMSP